MTAKSHYLKDELYTLIQTDPSVFEFMQAGSLDGIWYWDLENPEHEWMSPQFWTTLGYDPAEKEHLSVEWQDLIHPADLKRTEANLRKHLTSPDHPYDLIVRYRHKNGSLVWVRCRGIAIRNAAGKPIRVLGAHNNLTPQKRSEEALAEALMRQREAVKAGNVGLWDWDLTTDRVQYSAEWKRHIGYDEDEIGDRLDEWQSRVHPDDLPRTLNHIKQAIRIKARAFQTDFRLRHKDGSYRHILGQGSILAGDTGNPVRALGSHLDVTERIRKEEEFERDRALMKQAESVANVGGWEWDLRADRWYFTDEWQRIHGFDQPTASIDAFIDLVHPEDAASVLAALRLAVEHRTPYDLEHRIVRATDGETRWVHARGNAIPGKDGSTATLRGATQDVTEWKQSEADREKLQAQLDRAQRIEAVGRLAGGMAHDFNNMLTVILGHLDIMLEELPEHSRLRGYANEIRTAAESSSNLTRQLLAFARKQSVAPKELDLNETISPMLKMLQRLIGEDIVLEWKPGTFNASVLIDPGQVDQILANLVVNARDAIGHAHGTLVIETKKTSFFETDGATGIDPDPGDYIELTVTDNGCGMDEATLGSAFEPFFTTKGIGEGTGLGLAIVYGIVKQNHGFVNVASEVGTGTTVHLYFPALALAAQAARDQPSAVPPWSEGNETILIVEDQPALLSLVGEMLEGQGYTVLSASTPREALRLGLKQRPEKIDLLVTDVILPDMNGRDLAKRIEACHQDVKTLFMSGYTADIIAHEGVLDDGVCFIQKPFSVKDLVTKVRETLDRP